MTETLQTVERALILVQLLAERGELTVTEAALALDISPSVAHRLLATMAVRGFARRAVASRGYRVGSVLAAIGAGGSDADYIEAARRPLEWLQAETGETVHLGVLQGRSVRYPWSVVSRHNMRVESRVGDLLPAHLASAGRALLAARPDEEVRALYSEAGGSGVAPGRAALDDLEAQLATVRSLGYARNIEATEPGVTALAMAVRAPDESSRLAVSIAGPQARLLLDAANPGLRAERELVSLLRRAVIAIERALRA